MIVWPSRRLGHGQELRPRRAGSGPPGRLAVKVVVCGDAAALAEAAADLFRERVAGAPDLAMAVPAGRTPRRM